MLLVGYLSTPYIGIMRDYILSCDFDMPARTLHVFEECLPNNLKTCTEIIGLELMKRLNTKFEEEFKETRHISPIPCMNELYITCSGLDDSNVILDSDNVFETPHIDGPFFCLPYAKVFRCLIGIKGNSNVCSVFPTTGREINIRSNSFVAFDYNHDIHYVKKNYDGDKVDISPRILLKLHYIVYSPLLPQIVVSMYKMIHSIYNRIFRSLFLITQAHEGRNQTTFETIMSFFVNKITLLYCYCHEHYK